jgi:hypothetical protein
MGVHDKKKEELEKAIHEKTLKVKELQFDV